ncbi:MAG: phage capsid protein [Steroidobacteraceae bacterium]
MSINLGGTYTATDNAAVASYESAVKLAYQGSGYLRETVTYKTGVVGQQHAFRRAGAAVAYQQSASAEEITPNDTSHAKIFATLTNWRVGDYTDLFAQAETTIDERAVLSQNHGMALGRAEDQLIIAALDAATSLAGTVDEDFGATNSGLTADKLRRAKRYLLDQNARGDHYMLVNGAAVETMLAETEVTSSDYQTMKVLVDGDATNKKAFGFTFKFVEGNRVEGGLPSVSTSIRQLFAYEKSAVGLAVGIDATARTDFVPTRNSWLSQGTLKAGAAVIDAKGVVEVQAFEA